MSNDTTKHTPGPWDCYVIDADRIMAGGGDHCGGFDVYQTDGHGNGDAINAIPGHTEAEANARLIASAPDLLAALEFILPIAIGHARDANEWVKDGDENEWPWVQRARAALNRATGKDES